MFSQGDLSYLLEGRPGADDNCTQAIGMRVVKCLGTGDIVGRK